ncbi:DEAD/DEAH box helicase [Psychroflexus salis]|uniref:RNA helicase n=1 Tax=Psychroflexus salis TaxID=1526574 RepID=A0A917A0J1_9FLAO|nr:DEAD/DEAH box helicase [Psychroflexus salis]GGE19858.1 DEAD/DEAH box helicase [Psychroflexus salis]
MTNFSELGLQEDLLKAISDLGFESPSEVQAQAIPILLEKDTDLVALAQTGTGKTAAFGFPLIQKINLDQRHTQGLILSPTRELCLQITNEFQNYGKYSSGLRTVAVYGGASITDQEKQIKKGAQIIVATPGRMKDMLKRGMIDISQLAYCVLDEADEMLNMGFYEDITDILAHSPKEKSTWLFSATMPKEVSNIAKKFMNSPKEITVGQRNVSTKNVSHEYFLVSARDRYNALKRLVDVNPEVYACVFCRTKRDTQKVAERLIEDGYNAAALHGDLSQSQRDMVMKSFRNKQVQILVATDVAARGIDVDDITHVINYQLPDEVEIYTHRSGRTGRAGKTGKSLVILTKSELRKIKQIERIIGQNFTEESIPSGEEICEKQLFHLVNEIKETEINPKIDAYLPKLEEMLIDLTKEDLIKKFFSVEFTRFYNYYKDAGSISKPSASERDFQSNERSDETRFFINLGEKDGFNWMQLKDFLKETLDLGRDAVAKVDVKDSFSFFNVAKTDEPKVMQIFENFTYQGRNINVEITKDKGGRGGGRKRNDRKKSGGFGKRRDDNKSGFSGARKGKKSNVESSFNRRRSKKK